MRKRLLAIFLILILSACNKPTYSFVDTQHHTLTAADLQNKWIIINYWADWCEPCAEEVAQLNQFYQQKSANMVLIGVNYNELPSPALEAAIKKMGIEFPVVIKNPRKVLHLPQIDVVPTTFIINPQGKIVQQLQGPQTAAGLKEIIK